MTERLIRRRLLANERIVKGLGNRGAVYYQKALSEISGENYPQIILTLERNADAVHGVSGQLNVEIICTNETIIPEEIERSVRESLEGVFFRENEIILLKWAKSEAFEEPASERMPLIIGMLVTFLVYEFPVKETSEPDAVQALNEWGLKSGALVIGRSEFEEFVPSRERAGLYFDTEKVTMKAATNAVVWLEAAVRCHVFAPDVRSRREWLTALSHEIMLKKAVRMADESPLRITGLKVEYDLDEIAGQMMVTCEYGLVRARQYTHLLRKTRFESTEGLRYVQG